MPEKKSKTKFPSPFAQALAARKGDIPPESLTGSARHLFRDASLTQEALAGYAKPKKRTVAKEGLVQRHSTFKRG